VPYFFNVNTKQSSWEPPSVLTKEQVDLLPGAKEYLNKSSSDSGPAPGQVRASHLLVKHRGSRRPSSWKEVGLEFTCSAVMNSDRGLMLRMSQAHITRSKEEAVEILRKFEKEINGSAEMFAALATEHSDCSSHTNSGDLGWFGHGQMQKPFEDAAYGLQVGQISDVISSDSGVHLVLRTG
jgi:peptidyl-prolyl cis-trans isomerase NIMA-interacting 1